VPTDDAAALADGIIEVLNGRGVRVTPAMLHEYTLEAAAAAYLALLENGAAR
jgi:hypothetical protein